MVEVAVLHLAAGSVRHVGRRLHLVPHQHLRSDRLPAFWLDGGRGGHCAGHPHRRGHGGNCARVGALGSRHLRAVPRRERRRLLSAGSRARL